MSTIAQNNALAFHSVEIRNSIWEKAQESAKQLDMDISQFIELLMIGFILDKSNDKSNPTIDELRGSIKLPSGKSLDDIKLEYLSEKYGT